MSFLKQNDGVRANSATDQIAARVKQPIPAFDKMLELGGGNLRRLLHEVMRSWLGRTPSKLTRVNYRRDIDHFFTFLGVPSAEPEHLVAVRPEHVAAWRDSLHERGLTNATIRRKLTVL